MSQGQAVPVVLTDLCYHYESRLSNHQVLNKVSLEIKAGEIVILTGPSGSGKTTLLSVVGALRAAQAGSVQVLGCELLGASQRTLAATRRSIGYIFQLHNLLDFMSVAQNVAMALPGANGGLGRAAIRQRVEEVLAQVGLQDHVHKLPAALSGGQKQRVGIARALVNKPSLILADEPTASLDKESGRNIVNLIQQLCREQGASVVLVTHDNRILDVADRILHLEDGEIQTASAAVASNTSHMLRLLNRLDPAAAQYMSAFAVALTRVAMADNSLDDIERETIRRVLCEGSGMHPAEVDLVMELALSQVSGRHAANSANQPLFSETQSQHLLASLHAVAAADGEITTAELREIELIAAELGFTTPHR